MKAAAKAALAGDAQSVHEFVTVGRFMAARKDGLTDHHRAQIARLLAEGEIVAANAQANRWLAAQAAALANSASAEAGAAAAEAKKSAETAKGYAADAKKSADAATVSANQAAQSATVARNAAKSAEQDADAADASAAQAEFSAGYARDSAARADWAAAAAEKSKLAAGESAAEAEAAASQAWAFTRQKREAEIAEAKRQAAEEHRKKVEAEKSKKKPCYVPMTRDTVPPCMMGPDREDYELVFAKPDFGLVKAIGKVAWEFSGAGDIERCIKEPTWGGCTMAVVGVIPWGKAGKVWNGVEEIIDSTRLSRHGVPPCTPVSKHSFLAGTRVLMGDTTTRAIEDIRVGDQVLATDPLTGETGPRRVDATIYTPDDRKFTEIRMDSAVGSTLTATDHHPFWVEGSKAWKNAGELAPGDMLRAPDGGTEAVENVRRWEGLAPAYNLTVRDLHTYYVLAGRASVLVHNSTACNLGPNGWPVATMDNCLECAKAIKGKIGGDIYHMTDSLGARLGPSKRDPHGSWREHFVVVKDGKAYDAFTGPDGRELDAYRRQWHYWEYIQLHRRDDLG